MRRTMPKKHQPNENITRNMDNVRTNQVSYSERSKGLILKQFDLLITFCIFCSCSMWTCKRPGNRSSMKEDPLITHTNKHR